MAKTFLYTAVGDSLTFGTGAPEKKGFSFLVHESLEAVLPTVELRNYGVVGATTSETLEKIHTDANVRSSIEQADIVTLTSGGNDLIQAAMRMYVEGTTSSMKPPMRMFAEAYSALVGEIAVLNRTVERETRIVLTDCYNPFAQVRDAVLWVNFVNRCVRRAAEPYGPFVVVAPVYEAFLTRKKQLISDDGVHPNEMGHYVMAEAVNTVLYPIKPKRG
jgi:lysophospholipase L1-like esterase